MSLQKIDEYMKNLHPAQRAELKRIFEIIKQLAPGVKEKFSYNMPTFQFKSKYLIGCAAFKNHLSIYPGSSAIEALKDNLKDFEISKGTIRFTVDRPIPHTTIEALVKQRMSEIINTNY